MATQTGSYDFKAAKAAHDEASQTASNYIFKTTGHDAWVCDENAGPNESTGEAYGPSDANPTTGWRIGSVFELVRHGVSWFKLWVENNIVKLRLGKVDSGHILLDANSMDVLDDTGVVVATFGEIAQIGRDDSTHAVVDLEGLSVFDSDRSAAHFGIDGSRIYGPDSVPLFNIDTDGSVKTVDVVIGAPSADEGLLYENVTLSKTVSVPEFENGTSVSLRPTGQSFFGFETNLLVKFATNSQASRTYDISDATISSDGITLRFSNLSSSGIEASSIVITAGTPMSAYGTVDGIKYKGAPIPGLICTIDYRFDVLYDGNSIITFTHTISVERSPLLSTSELTYQVWYMSTTGTAQMKSPSYSIGTRFGDSGDYSATVGEGLIASSDNQTAIGKYNVADANDTYAFIIGNGTDDSQRSNALTVDWNAATKLLHPSIQRGTVPSSAIYGGGGTLELADQDGDQIGYFQPIQLADGSEGIQIGVSNEDGTDWNNIQLTFNGATPGVSVSRKKEWRDALGALARVPGSSAELPACTATSNVFPIVLGDTFANDGEISYMSTANFRKMLALGEMATPVNKTTSVANSSNVNVASISLSAGTWMVCARVTFPNNSTGRRAVKLSTTSLDSGNPVSSNVQNAASSAATHMSTSRCFKLTSASTVYLIAWQNSGGALSCVGDIEATRIG